MLRETFLALGLLASVAGCTGPSTPSEQTSAHTGSGAGTRPEQPAPPAAAPSPAVQPESAATLDAQALVGRRYWADPQRAGWTYEVDLCPGQRAIERNNDKATEGKYELTGTEIVVTFVNRVARFQFPSGPGFMLGTTQLGRTQKLIHKGQSVCTP